MQSSGQMGLINLQIEAEMMSELRMIADAQSISVDDVLNNALRFYVKKNKKNLKTVEHKGLLNLKQGFNKPVEYNTK